MAKSPKEENGKSVKNADSKASKASAKSSVIVAVLATVLVCVGVFLAIAFGTGMIKFSGQNDGESAGGDSVASPSPTEAPTEAAKPSVTPTSTSTSGQTYDNPNPKVKINGRRVAVEGLEFYLPEHFTEATKAGGGDDLAVTYNLTDDDGWADVKIYVKKTGKDARDFLLEKSPKLSFEQDALVMNGWSWSEGCAASCAIQAWATNYGDYVYAIILSVKLDSDSTSSASSMIPKSLYFEKLYK